MVMSRRTGHFYEFGPFRVDVGERVLLREGREVPLPPKVFETLLVLVENSGHILEKNELMKALWPDSFVEESSLSQNIFLLRKALGEGGTEPRYIETIPRRGYRFVTPVRESHPGPGIEGVVVNGPVGEPAGVGGRYEETPELILDRAAAAPDFSFDEGAASDNGQSRLGGGRSAQPPEVVETAPAARPRAWRALMLAGVALVVALGLGLYYSLWRRAAGGASSPFRNMRITRLTSTGKSVLPAISPDGKYVAHVSDDAGRQSVWIRQVAASSQMQLVEPAEVGYRGLSFTRDGNYLDYVVYDLAKNLGSLYRIPVLGGTPKKLIEDVDSVVAYSPDGRRLAFIRGFPKDGVRALMLADADGGGEQRLASRKLPEVFLFAAPAWSPDGRTLACVAVRPTTTETQVSVVGVSVADGKETTITGPAWARIGQVAWLADGSGLIMTARDRASSVLADQIWHLPYPSGEPQRITNDVNIYGGLSLAAEARAMVTTQSVKVSRLWLVPGADAGRATQIPAAFTETRGERLGMDWMPDGRIIYASQASGNLDVWVMNQDGSGQKQLTVEAHSDLQPAVSPDGRQVTFISNRAGAFNVWRMNPDGGQPLRLTSGPGEEYPGFTPDGKWVVYSTFGTSQNQIFKVPVEGGEPVRLTEDFAALPAVSPDGKLIACYTLNDATGQLKMSLIPGEGGRPVKVFETSPFISTSTLRWAADGQSLTYVETRDGVSNLWSQPVAGGAPRKLTDFKSDNIFRFAWSRSGRDLACERGLYVNDVVLISDFL